MLAGLRDRMNGPEAGSGLARQASGSGGPSGLEKSFKKMGTMFKRGSKNPSPSKDNLKSAVHVSWRSHLRRWGSHGAAGLNMPGWGIPGMATYGT